MAQNFYPQNNQNSQNKKPDEKLKFLKREEIDTMQKDVSRLREDEAREERIKISQVKISEGIKEEKKEQPEKIPFEAKNPEIKPDVRQENAAASKTENISEEKTREIKKEIGSLTEEKRKMERDLSWLPEEKIPLEKELEQLQSEVKNIRSAELDPVLREEKAIEEEKKIIEAKERESNFQDRQIIESKRWEIERKRKSIEERKWQIEERAEEKDQKIKKIELKLSGITGKEKELSADIQNISEKAKGVGLQEERFNLQTKLAAANSDLKEAETNFQNISAQKITAEKTLDEILSSEKALEEEISILEDKEAKAATLSEQKEIEQKRWETDRIRKETEEEKWQQQEKNKEIEQQFAVIKIKLEKKKEEKINLENKAKEIDAFLEKTGIKTPESAIKPEPTQKIKIDIPAVPPPPPPPPPSPIFKPEQKIPVPKKEMEQNPLSETKRVLIRLGILVVLIIIVAAAVWFFILKNKTQTTPEPSPSPSPSPTETPEIIIPPQALIPITETKTLEVSTYAELQNMFFSNVLQPKEGQGEFTRILIKNTSKNRFLGLKEFFEAFEATVPDGFYDKIDNDFTLFVYATSSGARLGFVAKINNKDGLTDLMRNWEKTMEKDLDLFLAKALGKNLPALSSYFKNAYFKKQLFRYQTFTKSDFGICYGIMNDYLIFTTSGRSMLKTIDLIPIQ